MSRKRDGSGVIVRLKRIFRRPPPLPPCDECEPPQPIDTYLVRDIPVRTR